MFSTIQTSILKHIQKLEFSRRKRHRFDLPKAFPIQLDKDNAGEIEYGNAYKDKIQLLNVFRYTSSTSSRQTGTQVLSLS